MLLVDGSVHISHHPSNTDKNALKKTNQLINETFTIKVEKNGFHTYIEKDFLVLSDEIEKNIILTYPLSGWWNTEWSDDGSMIDLQYKNGNNSINNTISYQNWYDIYGNLIDNITTVVDSGVDVYGRYLEQSIGIGDKLYGSGVACFPADTNSIQSYFTTNLVTDSVEYIYSSFDKKMICKETFAGYFLLGGDTLSYEGNSHGTWMQDQGSGLLNSKFICTNRETITEFYYQNKYFAKTVTNLSTEIGIYWDEESNSVKQGWQKFAFCDTIRIITNYNDGNTRETEIITMPIANQLQQWKGKRGVGHIKGMNIIDGVPTDYDGSITIFYSRVDNIGYYKTGYKEEKNAVINLPRQFPFEA